MRHILQSFHLSQIDSFVSITKLWKKKIKIKALNIEKNRGHLPSSHVTKNNVISNDVVKLHVQYKFAFFL